jgi:hypothetical protein
VDSGLDIYGVCSRLFSHHGHLFCRECIFSSLLSQKKDIKRKQRAFDRADTETPGSAPKLTESDLETKCTQGDHPLKLKQLLPVKLTPSEV